MTSPPKTSARAGRSRTWLDVLGCGLFAIASIYLCVVAPLTVVPIISLVTIPLAFLGLPVLVVALVLLAGFDRGGRRGLEGVCALGAAAILLVVGCVVGVGEFADPRVLRELAAGADFPWRDLLSAAGASVAAALLAAVGLHRSRHISLPAATVCGLVTSTLPLVGAALGLCLFAALRLGSRHACP